ncbi:MAG: hypothetical protein IJU48_08045 [Synergistaceae bacterium]|nr:hypothetical protein [Synergistaceae bacterium]
MKTTLIELFADVPEKFVISLYNFHDNEKLLVEAGNTIFMLNRRIAL